MGIPKVIHLCWFGKGKYPPLAEMCIESWKKYLPDYEIRIWCEDNFNVASCAYTKKAYEEKRWAFVSDYVRLYVLYEYGGVYMDTDLEVIRSFSHLLENRRFVRSYIEGGLITAGFLACEAGHPFVKNLLEYYDEESSKIEKNEKSDYVMNPLIFTRIAVKQYEFCIEDTEFYNEEITIYPMDYFMPYRKISFGESFSHWKFRITENTCTIHHDMSSWHKSGKINKLVKASVRLLLPQKIYTSIKIKKNLKRI